VIVPTDPFTKSEKRGRYGREIIYQLDNVFQLPFPFSSFPGNKTLEILVSEGNEYPAAYLDPGSEFSRNSIPE